jgi:YD repeat-containing protein
MNRLLSLLIARALFSTIICTSAGAQPAQDTTTTFKYDEAGNVKEVKNGLGHTTTYDYDVLSRRTITTDHNRGITRHDYDGRDHLTKVTDARLVETTYKVDGLGNLEQSTSGDSGTTVSKYDGAGNLTSRTDAKQQVTVYQYDALNRVTLIRHHDNSTVAYAYDQGPNGIGRLSLVTDSSGTIQYGYDAFGAITSEIRTIGGVAYTTAYHYDDFGRLARMTYPSGRSIDYERNTTGTVNQITTARGGAPAILVSNVSYQPFGPVKEVTFGNGRSQTRTYDLDGRMDSYGLSNQTTKVDYDAANRIKRIADSANLPTGTNYGYDALDRLTSAQTPTSAQSYEYDEVGNRKKKVINSAVTNYGYAGPGNRLTQIGSQAIVADVNGSITSKGNATFNYDARGRMVSANTSIGLVEYTINSLGQRVRKVTPTESTVYHYDMAGKLIAETTTAGSTVTTQEYVYLGDMPVAVLK